ncbi:MAG: TonB-dependent receptor [Gammaproteobacteria bacterium]
MTNCAEDAAGLFRALRIVWLATALSALLAGADACADVPWSGRELQDVIEELRRQGLPLLYSSTLIKSGMRLEAEPAGGTLLERLAAALHGYGLNLRAGAYGGILIVRDERPPAAVAPGGTPPTHLPAVPELVVTTSRYEIQREPVMVVAMLANTDLERLPDLGDDPLRAVGRLPGTAMNGLSAKTNIRGGATDENLVMFDDLRLFNPFHLKDFQSIFSSIDPAVIEGLDIYTGAFPTLYGDRLSGVINIQAFEPPGEAYRALSISLFNAAALLTGSWGTGRGTWLVSGRRGNLDLLLDLANQDIGTPRYSDLHGQLAYEFSDGFRLSANALIFDDNVKVYDSDKEERATARYHDSYLWLRVDNRPSESLEGFTLLSYANLRVRRAGTAVQPGVSSGELDDRRSAGILALSSRWSLALAGSHRIDFGGELRRATGRYHYSDEVSFDLLFDTPGAPTETSRSREIFVEPEGEYYATYANALVELPGDWTTELGLRWERTTLGSRSGTFSPRASLLYRLSESTRLRASWGRYWQSQGIDELAVSDGETTFARPERADQYVLGVEQELPSGMSLRLEGYTKDYRHPRDRYENLLNTIVLLPELKPDRIRLSANSATANGLELTLRGGRDRPLDWWISYGWASVKDEVDGVDIRRSWDQSHALGAGVLWSGDRWDLSAALTYRSGWPTTEVELQAEGPPAIVATGRRNAARLGNYATVDLRAARRFQTTAGLVSVFFELSNALNRRNDCCIEYSIDVEDTGELEVESQRGLPILPSVGIAWQF